MAEMCLFTSAFEKALGGFFGPGGRGSGTARVHTDDVVAHESLDRMV